MNSELLKKLIEINKENRKKIEELRLEYAELSDIERKQTSKDLKRIKEIRKELEDLSRYEELDKDLKHLNTLKTHIKSYEKTLGVVGDSDKLKKELLEDKIRELKEETEIFADGLAEKYSVLVSEREEKLAKEQERKAKEEAKEENKNNKKKVNKKALILAAIAALGIGTTSYAIGKNSGKSKNASTMESVDNTQVKEEVMPETTVNKKSELEERITFEQEDKNKYSFTDINDEEQVNERAYEVIKYLDENLKEHDYTVDEVSNIIRWINGGNVDSVEIDDAFYAISRVEDIMNKENLEEVKNTFDVSKLFLDNTRGQKLASQIYNSRKALRETKGTEEFNKNAEDFAKLIINSWLLNGTNGVQSAYSIEKAGMKTLIDTYFINTYAYINVPVNVKINVGGMESEFNLDDVAVRLNEVPLCDENGKLDENAMDKFSSDFNDMIETAKQVKENSNGLTLHK